MAPASRRSPAATCVEGEQVGERADAARCDDVEVGGGEHLGQPGGVRAAHQPLDLDLGDDDGLGAGVGQATERVGPLDPGALRPAADGHLAAAHVETERDRLAAGDGGDEVGVLQGGRAHHDAGHADVGQRGGRLGAAHAAARLHRHGDRGGDGGDEVRG